MSDKETRPEEEKENEDVEAHGGIASAPVQSGGIASDVEAHGGIASTPTQKGGIASGGVASDVEAHGGIASAHEDEESDVEGEGPDEAS